MAQAPQLVFGPFRLDPHKKRLWRGKREIALQPQPLAVLHYLVEHAGRVVPAAELLKEVWAGTYVTKTALKVCVRAIRVALGDDVEAPRYLETVGHLGYRFIGAGPGSAPRVQDSRREPILSPQHPPLIVVGREAELEQLHGLLAKTRQGQRQVVFVTGEPGIGKTTVTDLFLERVRVAGQVWIGRGSCLIPSA
jgi:DNA-binding winged helix-turn-helix (wHTH) protein